jgi:nucleotide-binding universal stress UspA family protein
MKTILVLTDFSTNAKAAAETALVLAQQTGADLLLFNTYIKLPFIPSSTYMAWPPEYSTCFRDESTDKLRTEAKRLQEILALEPSAASRNKISCSNAEGPLAENVRKIVKQRNLDMVIMGGRHKKAGDLIFGSDIKHVVNKVGCPVLIIPDQKVAKRIQNIGFATDLAEQDITALKWLMRLAADFDANINVCHICTTSDQIPVFGPEDKIYNFVEEMASINHERISFTELEGKHIVKELEQFNKETKADLLALVYKKHSIFWRLFHESPARNFIKHQNGPVLILPEHWENKQSVASNQPVTNTMYWHTPSLMLQ